VLNWNEKGGTKMPAEADHLEPYARDFVRVLKD
jgi:hypothetical protein